MRQGENRILLWGLALSSTYDGCAEGEGALSVSNSASSGYETPVGLRGIAAPGLNQLVRLGEDR